MNKKLVAVAIAGLLAAPLAQAQTANVTLYGRINIDMEFVHGRLANNTNPTVYRVTSNSSRFGLRGTESLGGGLNAIFQIENGSIRPTTGDGGNLAGRDSFVGLSGGWGTFKMGRYLAPYDDIHGIFGNDNTASTSILSTASVWAQGFAGQPVNGGFDDRLQQSIRYDRPSYAASSSRRNSRPTAARAARPTRPRRRATATTSRMALFYRNGPFVGGVAYEYHHNQRGTSMLPLSDWAFSVAAKWQFSSFNIAGVYEKMEYEVPNGTAAQSRQEQPEAQSSGPLTPRSTSAPTGRSSCSGARRGRHAAAPSTRRQPVVITPTAVIGAYARTSRASPAWPRATTRAPTQWEVSYSYDLSKRTRIYAGYVKINNDANASYNFNINAYPGNAGSATGGPVGMKVSGFVMGMYHNF